MEPNEFRKLVKKDKHQVFIFTSCSSFPVSFAPHYWFVTNKKGKINRWEVLYKKNLCKTSWGHLHENATSPTKGMRVFLPLKGLNWPSKLVYVIEGGKNSVASKMIAHIESSPKKYKYNYKYWLYPGPNSNTYAQWVIGKFPKSGFKLSWKAWGKNYK